MDNRICRVCLDATTENLISPCAGCRGSSAFVHYTCLLAFYRSRGTWHELRCPTCKHCYEGRAAIDLGTIGLEQVQAEHGENTLQFALMLHELGNAYGRLGDAERQRDLLERALVIIERECGAEHR